MANAGRNDWTRRAAIRNLTIAGVGLSFLYAFAPAATPEKDSDYIIRSDVPLVLMDVSVQDASGGFVSGLTHKDFHVTENRVPQTITAFSADDVPVTVGLLVDESYSMTPKRSDTLTAAMTFIQESNLKDEIFVVNFNDRAKLGLPARLAFSDDHQQLRAALYSGVAQGKTALYDAVEAGLKHLALGRREKKTLIVISDGGDNASKSARQQMLDDVENSLATIYTIGLFDADAPDRDPGILKRLAKISGGEVYFPRDSTEMLPVCRRIARDIRTRYTIGYAPQAGNGKNGWRRIRVEVSTPGRGKLVARTRTGYRYGEAVK